ncbi:MAG: phosphodiester glycosidase family protein, partial [Oscillospiraceae bacterium]|nr:phosphodiester glycosidase family protein [Oscillospiraceae bacterium]
CVLYEDGTMETYLAGDVNVEEILSRSPYQSWGFGPALLDADGLPKERFNTEVERRNPRSAIGYYEPGHYCFLVVDGRRSNYSYGLSMEKLSELFYELGCNVAYNLDGGATAVMANAGGVLNRQYRYSRLCSDILYITDPEEQFLPDAVGESDQNE